MITQSELETYSLQAAAHYCADQLGGAVPGTVPFRNMVLALQLAPWRNTPNEKIRLACALWAKESPKAYRAELQRRLD